MLRDNIASCNAGAAALSGSWVPLGEITVLYLEANFAEENRRRKRHTLKWDLKNRMSL
jgi:hypothetical protein